MPRELDRRVMRRERLHEHLALDVAASRASGDLREELERPLARTKIGQVQAEVGVDDANERDVWKVQPFRDHLRADEDVDLAGAERAERLAIRFLARHRVGVHALHNGLWENFRDGFLDFFRSRAGVADAGVLALGTFFRRHAAMPADVADEPVGGAMERERDAAIRALADVAADVADERRGETAPVEKQDRLLLFREPRLDRLAQFFRDERRAFPRFHPHVDDADERHLLRVHALREFEQLVFAGLRVAETFEGRRGAAEDHGAVFKTCPQHGDVASVVARRFLLLVGIFVLLIDDDEAEIFERREDGAARADDDARASVGNLVPLIVSLAFRQVAVQDRDGFLCGGEARFEALDGLRCERDFRHEHDGGLPAVEHELDGLEVNLRLAAAGDAVEQDRGSARALRGGGRDKWRWGGGRAACWRRRLAFANFFGCIVVGRLFRRGAETSTRGRVRSPGNCALHFGEHGGLLVVQHELRRVEKRVVCVGVALHGVIAGHDETLFFQRADDLVRGADFLEQLRGGDRGGGVFQEVHDRPLLHRFAFEVGEFAVADFARELHEHLRFETGVAFANDLRQHRAHRGFEFAAIVVGDPVREPHEQRREDRPGADDLRDRAHAARVRFAEHFDHRREQRACAHGNAHPRTDGDFPVELRRNLVVECVAARLIDEDARELSHCADVSVCASGFKR